MRHIIYKATLRDDGRCYIGKTVKSLEERRRGHLRMRHDSLLVRAMKKYGVSAFDWEVLAEGDFSVEQANELEKSMIEKFGSFGGGFNMTAGGDGATPGVKRPEHAEKLRGRKYSEETKEKIRQAHQGRIRPPEVGKKISESLKGKTTPMKGRKHSEEAKQKMSEAAKRQWERKRLNLSDQKLAMNSS
jgi:group I intron endonuclease